MAFEVDDKEAVCHFYEILLDLAREKNLLKLISQNEEIIIIKILN